MKQEITFAEACGIWLGVIILIVIPLLGVIYLFFGPLLH
jgi:hypothetical protein